jgi:hypothetical protein
MSVRINLNRWGSWGGAVATTPPPLHIMQSIAVVEPLSNCLLPSLFNRPAELCHSQARVAVS